MKMKKSDIFLFKSALLSFTIIIINIIIIIIHTSLRCLKRFY